MSVLRSQRRFPRRVVPVLAKTGIFLLTAAEFEFVRITPEAEGQPRDLGKALADPKLEGTAIAINGHTDAEGCDAFKERLSERRAYRGG